MGRMNSFRMSSVKGTFSPSLVLAVALCSIVIGFSAVSSKSLWIDEANSAVKALAPDWSHFRSMMCLERGSDLQMPLYMWSLWEWEKFAGGSERELRFLNVLIFVLAMTAAAGFLRVERRILVNFIILCLGAPIVWIYLDEARPYILEFLGSMLVLIGIVNVALLTRDEKVRSLDASVCFLGLWILFATSLSTVTFVFSYGIAFMLLWFRQEGRASVFANWRILMSLLIAIIPVLVYYMWTLLVGAHASGVGKTDALSSLFCLYEIAGFSGFGPGRLALRSSPLDALKSSQISLLAYGAFWMILLSMLIPSITRSVGPRAKRAIIFLGGSTLFAVLLLLLIGILKDFRVLGRHLMPAFPFMCLGLAWTLKKFWQRWQNAATFLMILGAVLWFCSSLDIRLAGRHDKDDYRSAAKMARSAIQEEGIVWWAADSAAAEYYGLKVLPASEFATTGNVGSNAVTGIIGSLNDQDYDRLPFPKLVILSKPDIYDRTSSLGTWITDHGFKKIGAASAFTFYACQESRATPQVRP